MKIFLTGGAGFIGSSIVEKLADRNEIVLYDNLDRNAIKNTGLLERANISLIDGNILDKEKLEFYIKGSEVVIHLAAIAGVDSVLRNPVKTMEVNMVGTHNVISIAKKLPNLKRFINFSTSEVYGSFTFKFSEDECTNMGAVGEARWSYAVSKLAGEHLSFCFFKEFKMPVVSLRPFNVYGPKQVGKSAIHAFIKKAIKNETIEVHGDGSQLRSWCFIDDAVSFVLLTLEKEEAIGNVFNVGNPQGTITIVGLAKEIIKITNSSSEIRFVPKLYTDVELRIPNIEKGKNLLGYEPKVDLSEGILRTAKEYEKLQGEY